MSVSIKRLLNYPIKEWINVSQNDFLVRPLFDTHTKSHLKWSCAYANRLSL